MFLEPDWRGGILHGSVGSCCQADLRTCPLELFGEIFFEGGQNFELEDSVGEYISEGPLVGGGVYANITAGAG
jgi:hypothetical protein